MGERPSALLQRLEEIHSTYGGEAAVKKQALLAPLARRRLGTAEAVLNLHEILCFLRGHPDDAGVLRQVEEMLAAFPRRSDLRRQRHALADSGIAGIPIAYAFYWHTVRWIIRRWPGKLTIDWPAFERKQRLDELLGLLMPYTESLALDEADLGVRQWVDRLRGEQETDAEFVIRRIEKLAGDDLTRESVYEELTIPYNLAPGEDTPSRTHARYAPSPVVIQRRSLDRTRPDLRRDVLRPPLSIRAVSRRQGVRLIDLVREAMVTRARDLYAFRNADPEDVRLVDCGDGLQFAAIGVLPEKRLMLDSVYGFLTLKNGVPAGYVLSSSYFNSTEVAYNVFETFRGGEAGQIYGRVLAMMRTLFGADAFTIDPYQLGYDNDEGLRSGAWWFYYKLGFRPRDAEVKRLVRSELARMRKNPRHRSSLATLQRLASENMYYFVGKPRTDVRGLIPLERIGLWVSDYLARRFGSGRERGLKLCRDEAARLTGVRSMRNWSRHERLAWERWAPLMLSLPGVEGWSREDRRALGRVARAKGGRRESDYVLLLDGHRRLRRTLLAIANHA